MLHLLKIVAAPDDPALRHWKVEAYGFLADAGRAFSPSMRQRIHLPSLYADALARARLSIIAKEGTDALPGECPFALDDLFAAPLDLGPLLARLAVE